MKPAPPVTRMCINTSARLAKCASRVAQHAAASDRPRMPTWRRLAQEGVLTFRIVGTYIAPRTMGGETIAGAFLTARLALRKRLDARCGVLFARSGNVEDIR